MLTGEYAVVDGALSIALPTKPGQTLDVKPTRGSDLIWHSLDQNGKRWFEANISLYDFSAVKTGDPERAKKLGKILKNAVRLNSEFLDKWNGFKVETKLNFPLQWGLGSSSSLIYCVAQWADINPFYLHFKVSNGSGYDIACAGAEGPITYQLKNDELSYGEVQLNLPFSSNLYFVYTGRKVDSAQSVVYFQKHAKNRKQLVKEIQKISQSILEVKNLSSFQELIEKHEDLISSSLDMKKVKDQYFPDYWASIKSLGAWGGDFILAVSEKSPEETKTYFAEKGLKDVISYHELIL